MATRSGGRIGGGRRGRRERAPVEDDTALATTPSGNPSSLQDAPPTSTVPAATGDPTAGPGTSTGAVASSTGADASVDPAVEQAWTDRAAQPLRHHQAWGQQPLAHQGWSARTWGDQSSWVSPGDSHLRPFTSTAQVPAVGRQRPDQNDLYNRYGMVDNQLLSTGVIPAVVIWERPTAPLALRVAVWLVALLLVVGGAGLVVHRVRPQWLRALEVSSTPSRPPAHASTGPRRTTSTSAPRKHTNATVSETASGLDTATVAVQASQYAVVVAAQAPCWVSVTDPSSFKPAFQATMAPGASQVFPSVQGQLTVQLGASRVVLQVQIAGKTVPGWQFTPSAAPFTLNFTSASG